MNRIVYTPIAEKRRSIKRRGRLFLFIAGLLTATFVGGAIYLLRLPQWQIRDINIEGLVLLRAADIEVAIGERLEGTYFGIIPRTSTIFFREDELTSLLRSRFLRISDVTVAKVFPHTLSLSVVERIIWGSVCNGLEESNVATTTPEREISCVYIDHTGFSIEPAPRSEGSLLKKITTDTHELPVGATILDSSLVEEVDVIYDLLRREGNVIATSFDFSEKLPSEIHAVADDGFRILFKRDDDLARAVTVLNTVIEEEIKGRRSQLLYIDLRFGNKVFYKFK